MDFYVYTSALFVDIYSEVLKVGNARYENCTFPLNSLNEREILHSLWFNFKVWLVIEVSWKRTWRLKGCCWIHLFSSLIPFLSFVPFFPFSLSNWSGLLSLESFTVYGCLFERGWWLKVHEVIQDCCQSRLLGSLICIY